MDLLFEEKTIKERNEMRLAQEVTAYHMGEAVKLYNNAVDVYNKTDSLYQAQEKAMIILKRAIPHLMESKKSAANNEQLLNIFSGMQTIMSAKKKLPLAFI